jgi:hypothetical protein
VTEFGKCVVLVMERLGLDAPPESYIVDVERLNEACAEWHRQPGPLRGGFLKFDLPDLLAPGPLITGNLPDAITHGWAANDAAKAFIRFVDERSGKRATLLMLQIVLLLQQAAQDKPVNAGGGTA